MGVAGKHARLVFEDSKCYVVNLCETGLKLNEDWIKAVDAKVELKSGDMLTIGERNFVFEYDVRRILFGFTQFV